jgi:predicted ATPase
LAHEEEAIALYDRSRHRGIGLRYAAADLGVSTRSYAAVGLWYLGYPDRALERAQEAVALARALDHPFSLGLALLFEAGVRCQRRESAEQRTPAQEAIVLSEAQGFPLLLGVAKVWHGEARASADRDVTGVAEVSEGLALAAGTGYQQDAPLMVGLLAQAQLAVGQVAEALATIEVALAMATQTGLPHGDVELHRGKGSILLATPTGDATEAEVLFRRALEIARAQEARSLELRTAIHLARLLRTQGKSDEAHALLAPVYAWFTEGFDTGDLVEAKALLDELT